MSMINATIKTITAADLLGWYFTMGSLGIGLFGLLYGIYTTIRLGDKEHLGIIGFLITFCRFVAWLLIFISGLSIYITYLEGVRWEAVAFVAFMSLLSVFVLILSAKMRTGTP